MLLAVAAAPVLGLTLAESAGASKPGKNTVASNGKRIENAKDMCELVGGGKMDTVTLPSGTKITYCNGGEHGGTRCKHTSQESTCSCSNTGKDGYCQQAVTAPPHSGVAVPTADSAHTGSAGGNSETDAAAPDSEAVQTPTGGDRRRKRRRNRRRK
jgi:hypothetical protein